MMQNGANNRNQVDVLIQLTKRRTDLGALVDPFTPSVPLHEWPSFKLPGTTVKYMVKLVGVSDKLVRACLKKVFGLKYFGQTQKTFEFIANSRTHIFYFSVIM